MEQEEQFDLGALVALPDLSRVAFFDGQRLAADDLNGAAGTQRAFRFLHNRSLHGWGIGLGFAVSGARSARQVSVAPGYAVDCLGREIVLTQSIQKPVPARSDDGQGGPLTFYLVAAYPDESLLTVLERRSGECGTDGVVRLQEQAAIYWKAAGEQTVELGIEIVLAQATVQNCQLSAPLSLAQRRSARPPRQPFVAAGESTVGATPWALWREPPGGGQVIGVTTQVDTSAGRFAGAPQYQAQLRGDRLFSRQDGPILRAYLLDGMTFVSQPRPNGFTLSVVLPRSLGTVTTPVNPPEVLTLPGTVLDVVRKNWSVAWVGTEG
jgi:hypothetical protein